MAQTWWVQSLQMKYWSPVTNSLRGLGCRHSKKYIHCKFECMWRWNIRTSTYLLFFLSFFSQEKSEDDVFFFPPCCMYIKPAGWEKMPTARVLIVFCKRVLGKLQMLPLLVYALGPLGSNTVNKTGEESSCWGRRDAGWQPHQRKHYFVCLPFSRCSIHKCDAIMYFNKELLQISWTVHGTELLMWLEVS